MDKRPLVNWSTLYIRDTMEKMRNKIIDTNTGTREFESLNESKQNQFYSEMQRELDMREDEGKI